VVVVIKSCKRGQQLGHGGACLGEWFIADLRRGGTNGKGGGNTGEESFRNNKELPGDREWWDGEMREGGGRGGKEVWVEHL